MRDSLDRLLIGRPLLIVLLAAAVVAAGALVLGAVGFRFDPFDQAKRRADQAEAGQEIARDDAAARGLEAEGERASAQRVDVVVRQAAAAYQATYKVTAAAWSAEDAETPLPPDRVDRLRAHDDELCRIRPTLAGCAAPVADPAGGGGELRDLPPAGRADPGGP